LKKELTSFKVEVGGIMKSKREQMKTKKRAKKNIKATRANKACQKGKMDAYIAERPKR